MSHKFQFGIRTLLIITFIIALLLGIGRWLTMDQYHIATISCGKDRKIIITADNFWEITRPVYYQIVIGNHTIVSEYLFYCAEPDERMRFSLVSANDGELVGVVSENNGSRDVWIIHDFQTGESWPAMYYYGDDKNKKRLHDAFDRLKVNNPDLRLSID